MFSFLIPLVLGFGFNLASAFTTAFSQRWGQRRGSLLTAILRNILGIPIWAIGFILAMRSQSPTLFKSTIATSIAGWLAIGAGGLIIMLALASIRTRAAKPSTSDSLVQQGIYGRVRHPIHSGTFLEFLGLVLINPRLAVAVASGLGVLWILLQTRFEEFDLIQRLPAYREYMSRVSRFIPRIRK